MLRRCGLDRRDDVAGCIQCPQVRGKPSLTATASMLHSPPSPPARGDHFDQRNQLDDGRRAGGRVVGRDLRPRPVRRRRTLGQIATSTNGTQWTQVWNHSKWDLTSVAYGNGHFVAVDAAVGSTLISANGIDWGLYPPVGTGLKWGAVVFGNGTFVALRRFRSSGTWPPPCTDTSGRCTATLQLRRRHGRDIRLWGVRRPEHISGIIQQLLSRRRLGATWSLVRSPPTPTADWSDVAYGAHRFVEVDSAGNIAWATSNPDCAAEIPTTPRQVSGNVASGQVWTYMHPSLSAGWRARQLLSRHGDATARPPEYARPQTRSSQTASSGD